MSTLGYYPGCALHGSSNDYEASVRACLGALDIGLNEIDDWVCCGATAAHSLNHTLSLALPARNLGIAERAGITQLLAPCPMCSMELMKTTQCLVQNPDLREKISTIVEADVSGSVEVLNLIQVLQQIGVDRIRKAVRKPLKHINAACYYGCLMTRPPKVLEFDDAECPSSMEAILEALGATCVQWSSGTECCGAGMTIARPETVLDLSHAILSDAEESGANCIVVACPMCHLNLDMKQEDINRRHNARHDLLIYYLTDLVGLALGLSEESLAIPRHFVVKQMEWAPEPTEEE